jgi:ribulose-5-phosphate 4-epimerase/fuculose-1-phosphate aldolase
VATGCRAMHVAGLDDLVWGHLAVRDSEGRGVWMKSSGSGLDEVTPERVILVGWDGEVLAGEGSRPVEYPIHTEVMKERPDVGATMHAHPTYAIAFMATGEPLRPISHDGAWLAPPDVPRFTETGNLIRTAELGQSLAHRLAGRSAVFIPHHGVVTVGIDVPHAVMTGVLLERSCRLQLLAQGGGGLATWSSDEEATAKREVCWPDKQIVAGWEYLVRRVSGEPDM